MKFLGTSAGKGPPIPLLGSFLGFFDIKLGVTIIYLLSLLNKVAGVYGILAIFTGASLTQVSEKVLEGAGSDGAEL